MCNILTEQLIRYDKSGGDRANASLPEVYASLIADNVEAFPALRPHQRHAWHAFLVQLGAMAMHRAGESEPPEDPETWAEMIRALTPDFPNDEPWQLVVDDITKPAFMQPPASSWAKFDEKELFWTPDNLDMLDTARNHDLKDAVAMAHQPEDWAFALVTMQTMNGQVGRGNYPIARMNSGDGSRTTFSITPSLRIGVHVRRDITVMLERAVGAFAELPYQWNGIGLLWTERWDGEKEAIPLSSLHPFHIEICRRRRLCVDSNGQLYAMKAASGGRRIAADELRGVVGDPWTLVTVGKDSVKALTLQTDSFNYKNVTTYLTSSDWQLPVLFSPTDQERNAPAVHLVMRGIRRTQGGQTEKYHERIIPFREKVARVFGLPGGPQELGDLARERIKAVGTIQDILRHAIATFAAHSDTNQTNKILRSRPQDNPLRKKVDEWVNKLDELVDARFFEDLQTAFEADNPEERKRIHNEWLINEPEKDGVVDHARKILSDALDSLPCPSIHRLKARASAEGLFEGRMRGNGGLPFLFTDENRESE